MKWINHTHLWSHHEETRELSWERDNARNNRTMPVPRKRGRPSHSLDGQHQDVYRKSQSEWQRTEINGESTFIVWPTTWQDSPWKSQSEWQRTEINGESTSIIWPNLESRTAKERNRTCEKVGLCWHLQITHVGEWHPNYFEIPKVNFGKVSTQRRMPSDDFSSSGHRMHCLSCYAYGTFVLCAQSLKDFKIIIQSRELTV